MNKRFFSQLFLVSASFLSPGVLDALQNRDITIDGRAIINDQAYDTLTINGKSDLKNLDIKKDANINGKCEVVGCTFNALTINGKTNLNESTIHGIATIRGKLSANKIKFMKDLVIHGKSSFDESIIHGVAIIHGKLSANKLEVMGELKISGKETELKSSLTKNIVVEKNYSGIDCSWSFFSWRGCASSKQLNKQEICLIDTSVDGNIVFKSGEGVVKLHRNSKITGTVSGGVIQRVD